MLQGRVRQVHGARPARERRPHPGRGPGRRRRHQGFPWPRTCPGARVALSRALALLRFPCPSFAVCAGGLRGSGRGGSGLWAVRVPGVCGQGAATVDIIHATFNVRMLMCGSVCFAQFAYRAFAAKAPRTEAESRVFFTSFAQTWCPPPPPPPPPTSAQLPATLRTTAPLSASSPCTAPLVSRPPPHPHPPRPALLTQHPPSTIPARTIPALPLPGAGGCWRGHGRLGGPCRCPAAPAAVFIARRARCARARCARALPARARWGEQVQRGPRQGHREPDALRSPRPRSRAPAPPRPRPCGCLLHPLLRGASPGLLPARTVACEPPCAPPPPARLSR